MTNLIIACLILFGFSSASLAGELSYTCKVIHVYDLADDGSLRKANWEGQFRGSAFSVSRVTGEIVGEVVPTLLSRSTRVVNNGGKEHSFKSVADFGNQVQLIEVQEFVEGNEKPFAATSMGGAGIVTGLCK